MTAPGSKDHLLGEERGSQLLTCCKDTQVACGQTNGEELRPFMNTYMWVNYLEVDSPAPDQPSDDYSPIS